MIEETKVVEENGKPKKEKSKARKIIEWALTGIFGVIFVIAAIGQIMGMVDSKNHYGQTIRFGYCTFVVQTDSMEPKYKVGSAIITYYQSLDKVVKDFDSGKDVDISFFDAYSGDAFTPSNTQYTNRTNNTGVVMTHRLREYRIDMSKELGKGRYTFITSGINIEGHLSAQDQYQAFTDHEFLGVVVSNSNVLGGVFSFMTSAWGLILILLVPAGYVVVVSVIDIFKAYDDNDEDENKGNGDGGNGGDGSNSAIKELSEEDKKRLKEQLLQEMLDKAAAKKKA